jgi:hypothetical protein
MKKFPRKRVSYLLKQRKQNRRTLVADERGDANDVLVEGDAKLRIVLIVQKSDHVREDDIVG